VTPFSVMMYILDDIYRTDELNMLAEKGDIEKESKSRYC